MPQGITMPWIAAYYNNYCVASISIVHRQRTYDASNLRTRDTKLSMSMPLILKGCCSQRSVVARHTSHEISTWCEARINMFDNDIYG